MNNKAIVTLSYEVDLSEARESAELKDIYDEIDFAKEAFFEWTREMTEFEVERYLEVEVSE